MIQRLIAPKPQRLLVSILGLALLTRLVRVDARGFQYDDVFSIFLSARSLPEILKGTAADTMPPLYYLLLHFWMQIASPDWYLRLLSVGFSLLAVTLLYHWVLTLTANCRAALVAAFLMAISPFQYYHAQDVRNYSLLLSAELGYMLFFAKIWKQETQRASLHWGVWVGFALCALAAMYTHNVAALALALPNLYLICTKRWKLLLKIFVAQSLVGLLTLPWLVLLPGQLAKVQRAWSLWPPGWVDLLQLPIVWSAGLPLPGWWLLTGAVLGTEILVLLLVEIWRGRKEFQTGVLLLTAFGLPLIFFGLSYLMRPIFVPRGFILASAGYLGLAGWAIDRGWERGPGKLLLGGFILAAGIGLVAQATFSSFPRSPFEAAAFDLKNALRPGEVVLHDNKLSFFPMLFYQPDISQQFLADPPGSGNDTFAPASQHAMQIFPVPGIESAVKEVTGLYFVVFTRTIQEYHDLGEGDHPYLAWLDDRYQLVSRAVYNDLEIYHYVQP